MSFSWEPETGYYVPVSGPVGCETLDMRAGPARLKPILENAKIEKVGHNIKYDLLVMRQAGVNVRGVALDTMIAAFLIDASRMQYGIDQLALDLLNFKKIATDRSDRQRQTADRRWIACRWSTIASLREPKMPTSRCGWPT